MNTDENTTTPEANDLPGDPSSEQQGGAGAPSVSADAPPREAAESGASQADASGEAAGSAEPASASASSSEQGEDAAPPAKEGAGSAPAAVAAPRASSGDEDWEEEPGDDIGNRLPGPGGGAAGARRYGQQPARPHAAQPARAPSPPKPQRSERGPAPAGAPSDGGPAQAQGQEGGAQAEEGAEGGATPAKKRRRRRRKGGAAGIAGQEGAAAAAAEGGEEAAEGAEDEAGEASADVADAADAEAGEQGAPAQGGGERRKQRHKGPGSQSAAAAAAARERPAFSVGEEVFGKVYKLTPDAVWIDIAGKATGLFDRRELMDEEPPLEGDQFIATVASTGVRGGMLVLSRTSARLDEARTSLEAASKSGESVTGFVTGAVKGGLEVDLGGLRAFAPASHVDLRHGADLSYLVGQRLDFTVTQYAKKGRDIVVSRKKMLEEDAHRSRAEAMSKIEPGTVHKGIVRKVVAWGVFITLPDAGGVEGLVHMTEASHDRGAKLNDLFRPGAEIEVKVIRVDEKGKLWLSRKAVTADPWDAVKEKYAVGTRHKGKVARLQPFGAFIELEPGVDGLCHTADLSLKPIQHPQEVVKVGDEIDVVVASCDSANRKIGLHPAPPASEEGEARQRIQQSKTVKVAVVQVTEGGLVVRVLGVTGRSSRAFIPAGHTGTQRGTDLRKEFPIDTRLEAKVLEVDPRRGEAKLSIRALKEDAEKQAYQQYRAGVAREAKFGTFADLMKKSST